VPNPSTGGSTLHLLLTWQLLQHRDATRFGLLPASPSSTPAGVAKAMFLTGCIARAHRSLKKQHAEAPGAIEALALRSAPATVEGHLRRSPLRAYLSARAGPAEPKDGHSGTSGTDVYCYTVYIPCRLYFKHQ